MKPSHSILPVVRCGPEGEFRELLGTGFLAGSRPHLVSAAHVLDPGNLEDGDALGVGAPDGSGSVNIGTFGSKPFVSSEFDVAAVAAKGFSSAFPPLPLATGSYPLNHDVLVYEFSTTHRELNEDGIPTVHFKPFTHKGNITRYYQSDRHDRYPDTPSFNTSFSVLQGASGAPVLGDSASVLGMIVESREMELLPAQVVTARLDGKDFEEIKYFLPMGVAIRASVIIEFLESIGETPTVV